MKKKSNAARALISSGRRAISHFFKPFTFRLGPALATIAAFLVSLGTIIIGQGYIRLGAGDRQDFEAGRVADQDVIANRTVSYLDEEATKLLIAAQEQQMPAVFTYSNDITRSIHAEYRRFEELVMEALAEENRDFERFSRLIPYEFPGKFSADTLESLYRESDWERLLGAAYDALEYILDAGIAALPETGLEGYNGETAELYHNAGSRIERETVKYSQMITVDTAGGALEHYAVANAFPPSFVRLCQALVLPFISANVFFSPEDTRQKAAELRDKVQPILKRIERGTRIIRKGFVITEEDMVQLRALGMPDPQIDPRIIAGQILIFLLLYVFLVYIAGPTLGRALSPAEVYLLSVLSAFYIIGAVFFQPIALNTTLFSAIFLPTAVVVMLPAILIAVPLGAILAAVLPLAVFLTGFFDTSSFMFALTSGLVAVYAFRGAQKRMDLVKAGLVIGGAGCIASVAILLIAKSPLSKYPVILFWAAFNGLASGMLALGLLPILEHALNAVTTFRLIELSDLNAPLLKQLFSVAPGTYSHSVMVANLAEAACQEIGANPLLARVGAYYHDVGKMEQPSYFVENQTVYNKHNDINPRLSATVIRSHVKLGVEKARSRGLPKAVIDIIQEHHGNSVISWFYQAALKRESQVNREDFTYPGTPPRSRESAVVMLADMTEAAVRTLKKPTAAKIEKFIQELIMAKFEHEQLSQSELTFRDLETIKKAFVRVLTGYYHTRIEYPKSAPKDGRPKEGRE
ncbi:MAG: HDIG domain-containing protein [Treponema sp.]|jgi:putative nucleotidyltransferase with HDIG domain|nr:HDIG domain-containing protein [Treponema sp.]